MLYQRFGMFEVVGEPQPGVGQSFKSRLADEGRRGLRHLKTTLGMFAAFFGITRHERASTARYKPCWPIQLRNRHAVRPELGTVSD